MKAHLSRIWDFAWLSPFLDIAVKFATLAAIVTAGYFLLWSTDVVVAAHSARMINVDAVIENYQQLGLTAPPIVVNAAYEYNHLNASDLRAGKNASENQFPVSDLCTEDRPAVEALWGSTACEEASGPTPSPTYLRLLVQRNATAHPLDTGALITAREILLRSEYRRYRVCVRNTGDVRATSIVITASAGYTPAPGFPSADFSLLAGKETTRDFIGATGYQELQPRALNDHPGTQGKPGSKEGVDLDATPTNSCLRTFAASTKTLFQADWQNQPAPWRPLGLVAVIVILGIVGFALLFFGKRDTPPPPPPAVDVVD